MEFRISNHIWLALALGVLGYHLEMRRFRKLSATVLDGFRQVMTITEAPRSGRGLKVELSGTYSGAQFSILFTRSNIRSSLTVRCEPGIGRSSSEYTVKSSFFGGFDEIAPSPSQARDILNRLIDQARST